MPDSLSTVLFDLYDTLLDSFGARFKTLQSVFTQANITHPTAEQFLRSLNGTLLKDALAKLEETLKIENNLFEDYRRTYWAKKPGLIRLYPGVKSILERLHSRGVKLGVVTQKVRLFDIDGHSAGASKELEELDIADLFSVVVGFEDVSQYKPDPEPIIIALNNLTVQPREALMVGDSAADIESARAAGCWTCYATWGLPSALQTSDTIQADLTAEAPEAILEFNL
jgi:pyrophosphatase PpaX